MMTYEEYKMEITQLNAKMKAASDVLKSFPTGEMGLTPDHIKATNEYKTAKFEFEKWFRLVQKCNAEAPKKYKIQMRKERGRC